MKNFVRLWTDCSVHTGSSLLFPSQLNPGCCSSSSSSNKSDEPVENDPEHWTLNIDPVASGNPLISYESVFWPEEKSQSLETLRLTALTFTSIICSTERGNISADGSPAEFHSKWVIKVLTAPAAQWSSCTVRTFFRRLSWLIDGPCWKPAWVTTLQNISGCWEFRLFRPENPPIENVTPAALVQSALQTLLIVRAPSPRGPTYECRQRR